MLRRTSYAGEACSRPPTYHPGEWPLTAKFLISFKQTLPSTFGVMLSLVRVPIYLQWCHLDIGGFNICMSLCKLGHNFMIEFVSWWRQHDLTLVRLTDTFLSSDWSLLLSLHLFFLKLRRFLSLFFFLFFFWSLSLRVLKSCVTVVWFAIFPFLRSLHLLLFRCCVVVAV